ncbi:MAG: adenylate/guanylate cyclase domain-containing protein, partial [Spirochaetes bacterium]|nr:adenylate/guanylate cyclase domain-containing protein [Spirochaetota bacterium]
EIGQLAQTFNLMVEGLEAAYGHVRSYARTAGVSRRKEVRTLNTFQTYVPREVIEQATRDPKGILQGEERNVSVLFSHIHGFAEISEEIGDPEKLVSQLNRYFKAMVDVVTARKGIVDKYIDDAVMALFGHGERRRDDVLQSVHAGLDMIEAAERFNQEQKKHGRPEFPTSVGISYGVVTVGNIGCERKMGYTVIGDRVNLASRAQGMCKVYHQPIIFTGSVFLKLKEIERYQEKEKGGEAEEKAKDLMPCQMIDYVAVKGKRDAERIYTVNRNLAGTQKQAWSLHNAAMEEYYPNRNFSNAITLFSQVQKLLPGDRASATMIERCRRYEREPPGPEWGGYEVMKTK